MKISKKKQLAKWRKSKRKSLKNPENRRKHIDRVRKWQKLNKDKRKIQNHKYYITHKK